MCTIQWNVSLCFECGGGVESIVVHDRWWMFIVGNSVEGGVRNQWNCKFGVGLLLKCTTIYRIYTQSGEQP